MWKAIRDQGVAPGSLAVVRTESNLEEGNDSGLFAHVALIRNPRMVVNYEGYSGSSPNTEIKGVYIASNDADNYLRKTEPSSHDRWDINIGESSGPEWEKTGTIVKSIKSRIKREIQTIQQSLRQQPKRAQVPLSWANELFAQLFSEPTKAGKKSSVEGLSKKKKQLRHALLYDSTLTARDRRSAGNGRIVVQETWSIILADEVTDDVPAIVDFAAWALADGKEAKASDRLSVEGLVLPAGFQQTDEGVLGTLEPGKTYEFSFSTVPYEQDWNVRTDVSIKAQTSDEAQGQVEEVQ